MKKIILSFLTFLILFSSNIEMSETLGDLIYHKDLYYKKLSDDPFSGKTTGKYQGAFNNGKQEGPWIYN